MSAPAKLGLILLLVAFGFWVGFIVGARADDWPPPMRDIIMSPQPTYRLNSEGLEAQKAIVREAQSVAPAG